MARQRSVNPTQASERLAITEFNTWYVAGLAARLQEEGATHCRVYRAGIPRRQPAECSVHEGQTYDVAEIITGHRIGYWPPPGVPGQLSIPAGPGCHHTIERVEAELSHVRRVAGGELAAQPGWSTGCPRHQVDEKHQCCVRCNIVSDLRVAGLPGAARLMLADGVVHLDPASAVFEAMLEGWAMQQRARFLKEQHDRAAGGAGAAVRGVHEPVPVAVGAGGG